MRSDARRTGNDGFKSCARMRSDARRIGNDGFKMRPGGTNGRKDNNYSNFKKMRSSAGQSKH
jgi:hypothetical protein